MNRDWIVIDMSTGQFRCLRCGDVVGVGLPVSVDELCRRSFAFTSYHMDCEPESAELAKEIDKLRAENAAIQRANKELNRLIDDEIRGRMGPA